MFEKILLNRHQTISNLLIAKNLLIWALYMQKLVLLVSFRSEIESRMSVCKSRDTLFLKFENIHFTSDNIFLILEINFVLNHWLIVESLRRVHIISIFSQILLILKTLSQCFRCSSLSLIFHWRIISFLLLRWLKILIVASSECTRL